VLVIFYASNAMMSIIKTFDTAIYKQKRKASFIKKRIKAIKLTIIVLGMLTGTILLSIGQGMMFDKIMKWMKIKGSDVALISTLKWVITIGLFFYGISYIYRYAPSVKKRWPLVTPGSFLATFLIMATTYIFSFWVNHFANFNKIYGSLGTIMILMLLIYFNSLILLIGFELNLSITFLKHRHDSNRERELRKSGKSVALENLKSE
jgi:membrane protein